MHLHIAWICSFIFFTLYQGDCRGLDILWALVLFGFGLTWILRHPAILISRQGATKVQCQVLTQFSLK
jgi:hypothetical protein